MVKRTSGKRRTIESDVVAFLSEFARYLVAVGITSPRFSALSRLAYFRAALSQARFANERVNQSAVSAMTGLTRVQVRRFAGKLNAELPEARDRLDRVIEGWVTDPAFVDSKQAPKRLPLTGRGHTFDVLAKKYGGDIPPRSLARELQRHGYVSLRRGEISLNPNASRTYEEIRLRSISKALAALIANAGGQVRSKVPVRSVSLEITFPASSEKGRVLLQKRAAADLRAYLQGIKAAGTSVSLDLPAKRSERQRLTRSRVLMLTEDFEE